LSGNLRTLSQKVWDAHVVHEEPGAPSLIYVDLHLVHEVTSPQAFSGLRERGLKVRRPDLTVATVDHSIPTTDRSLPIIDTIAAKQVAQLEQNCKDFGIPCYGVHSSHQGIVHVIGPELGLTQPGMTVVCGDSHTATHGAFGPPKSRTFSLRSASCSGLRKPSACASTVPFAPAFPRKTSSSR
jgi:3-isopropylmalate/(R)-2-methylmalate dehydratase large subunit